MKRYIATIVILIFALAINACADGKLNNIYETLNSAVLGNNKNHVTPELVKNVPYASMSGQIGSGPVSFLVLGTVVGNKRSWYSADRNVFVTHHGRLVKTAGLPKNMNRASYSPANDPVMQFNGTLPMAQNKARMHIDLSPDDLYGLILDCEYTYLGRGSINILNKSYRTDALEENCEAQSIDWDFRNIFWIDVDTRTIRQSVEHIHPKIPPVKLQLLKPAAAQ